MFLIQYRNQIINHTNKSPIPQIKQSLKWKINQLLSIWTCFFLIGQKFQSSISFTSFAKSLVKGILALLSIFNGEENKMVFWLKEVRNCN